LSAFKKLSGPCAHCGGPIEFDPDSIGQTAPCPYCRRETELHLASLLEEPAIPRRVVIWTAVGILILILGLLASLFGLKLLEKKAAEREQDRQSLSVPGAR